jgi:small subunit ribosomal protein S6
MNNIDETTIDARVYEVAYIFVSTLTDEEATAKAETLKAAIAAQGGSFVSEEAPYMRELAYEMVRVIKNVNTRFNDGYFGWIKFEMEPNKINDFDKKLALDEEIVRFITVKADREVNVYTKKLSTKVKDLGVNDDISDTIALDAIAPAVEIASEAEVKELN